MQNQVVNYKPLNRRVRQVEIDLKLKALGCATIDFGAHTLAVHTPSAKIARAIKQAVLSNEISIRPWSSMTLIIQGEVYSFDRVK